MMKRCIVLTVLLASLSPATAQNAVPPDLTKPIDINQALTIAFANNPDLRIAVDELNKARQTVNESLARFNPQFNGQFTNTFQGPKVTVDAGALGTFDVVPNQNFTAGAVGVLPLDISKKLGYASDIARLQFQINYQNLLTVAEALIFNVKRAYFNVLSAQSLQEVAQKAVDNAQIQLKDATAKFKAGTVAKFDVTRAEVQVANNQQDLIVAKKNVATAVASLNRLMGIDVNTPTQVVTPDNQQDFQIPDAPKAIETAYQQRPEIRAGEIAVQLSKRNVALQRTGILPTANLTGNIVYQATTSGFSSSNNSWVVTAQVQFPIWDGGITKARVAGAHAEVAKSKDSLDQLKLRVSFEVKASILNLQEASERVKTSSQNVALAEEALRLARVRYEAGLATLVEVTDSETALTRARFNNVQANYDYAIAVAEIQRSTSTQPELRALQLLCAPPQL
jgi:outer membrane protein